MLDLHSVKGPEGPLDAALLHPPLRTQSGMDCHKAESL